MSSPFDPDLERLLDVAAEEITAHGFGRTSINDIARRARVSRPTAYRRLGGKDTLLQLLLARVAAAFWSDYEAAVDGLDAIPERAGESLIAIMRTARAHPMVSRLLAENPDLILHALDATENPLLLTSRHGIERALDPAHTLTNEQAARVAEVLERLALSFLTTPSEVIDDETLRNVTVSAIATIIAGGQTSR